MSTWSDTLEGLGACAISAVFFGSMFVPLKREDAGDGMFTQWVMGAAIFFVGMIVNAFEGFPTFHPLAMLGGALWATGNITAVPILSTLGMGMGMLIWGTMNCLCGWAAGRFGLFGLIPNVPNSVPLNYIGLICVLIGGVLLSQMRPNTRQFSRIAPPLYNETTVRIRRVDDSPDEDETTSLLPSYIRSANKRIIGVVLSLLAGAFYGFTFVPVIYIQQHPEKFEDASPRGLSYVFAHYSGIFITSSVFLIVYVLHKRNRPFVNNRSILPAYITGTMWAIAQTAWFVANDRFSQAITFPINAMVPGVCAALWSVFYFREIEGQRNLRIMSAAISITMLGAILVGISKNI
uniref:Transmembrane protein 144 n=1 Tax=Parascaris univalens TaxID=6257 RepID=A0A915CK06_PARUN